MFTRTLGRSGIVVSALGLGCWTIGGTLWRGDRPSAGARSTMTNRSAPSGAHLSCGVTFFDTADVYGAGHSERVLGQALGGDRSKVIVATKFGNAFDEATRQITGAEATPEYVRQACEASLRRLGMDVIDLYQFHVPDYELDQALATRDALEELVEAGKIRYYGWSTDDPDHARLWADGPHYTSMQQRLNIFEGNRETLAVCDELNLASINRTPLGKGLLTGKFTAEDQAASG